jgi:RNA polymerase sigma factor (sigma-70 family)
MPKIVSVDPTGWILNSVLGDYYRSVLPLGDTHRPDSELQALMEAAPHEEPRSVSPSAADKKEISRRIRESWPQGKYPKNTRAQPWGGGQQGFRPAPSPIDAEQDETVREALEELDERDRVVLELFYGARMSLRQVEQYTGIPKTTVARRRDLAPQLLAEILKRKLSRLADKYDLD